MKEIVDSLQQKSFKVLLIGDSCIDYYHYGQVNRISPEAPIPIFDIEYSDFKSGMAANVLSNLDNFKIDTVFHSQFVEKKHRYIDIKSKQQVIRVDEKIVSDRKKFSNKESYSLYDAIVISDYNKGYVDYELIESIINECKIPIFLDTKKNDLQRFQGSFLKINEIEWNNRKSNHDNVIITRGGKNVEYCGKFFYPPKIDIHDVCGAGDTFLAALVAGYLATTDMTKAIEFAMKASSITVRKMGVYAPILEEILND